jgi:acyl carrier protein
MVQREQIIAELTELVKKAMVRKNIEIHPDANLQADLGLDSMGLIEIATKLEDQYNIQFDDSEMKKIKTLNATVDLLVQKLEGRS